MLRRAFIVRPFGPRSGIDFDAVDTRLIQPALEKSEIEGATTGVILEAGNIREDMFQQLLVADLVVADVSVHNANVFYELGIRHALQPRRTVLIRARQNKPRAERGPEDEVPFDLRTERYIEYDPQDPAEAIASLTEALRQTFADERVDSPVFSMLPGLQQQDRSRFIPVPSLFREAVDLAAKNKQVGLLGLLAEEARSAPWGSEGLRLIGRAQFNTRAHGGAKVTWEALIQLDPLDAEANQRLATIYQRLGDLNASDQALQRILSNPRATSAQRAEALSLLGRNIKDRWRAAWGASGGEQARRQALRSPYLLQAFEKYKQGFDEDLNAYYPGLNALSLLTIAIELARQQPELWEARFQDAAEAAKALKDLEAQRQVLSGAVAASLAAAKSRLVRAGAEDRWLEISVADYRFLTSDRASQVSYAYETALAGAASFEVDSARAQVQLFQQLDLLAANVETAIEVFPPMTARITNVVRPARVVLFTGHMIDLPGRVPERFPTRSEASARTVIRDRLQQEIERTEGAVVGVASAASGGDILFHEVARDLKIERRLLLPLPPDLFRNESVSPVGSEWEKRFDVLMREFPSASFLARTDELPTWLGARADYNTWQRANLWMIYEAVAIDAQHLTLLALWDGTTGDGPGGTEHMIRLAKQQGASTVIIRTQDLV